MWSRGHLRRGKSYQLTESLRDTQVSLMKRDLQISPRKRDTPLSSRKTNSLLSSRKANTPLSPRKRDCPLTPSKREAALSLKKDGLLSPAKILPRTPQKKSSSSCDIQVLHENVSQTPIVIILEDMEGFQTNVLQDFITICR